MDEEDTFKPPEEPVTRPQNLENSTTVNQIREIDVLVDIVWLLFLMEVKMATISSVCEQFMFAHSCMKEEGASMDRLTIPLMQVGVCTNMTIQYIQSVESEIALEHPGERAFLFGS